MVPVSLSLRNFLSYGEHVPRLDFTGFRVACLSGDNGHGKSALLDAITYALWGEARKGNHDRKPDAGLLRLGAEELRVEFCFDLDAERFRVIRSFRQGRRAGSAQLELQAFDSTTNVFRSLSEGNSLTRTQQRIERLLSMDYETFINSAFIVQGKADEFTHKSAHQRKEILAEILGLKRYDQLQELARAHFQERHRQAQEMRRRIEQLEIELHEEPGYRQQLDELAGQLEALAATLANEEKRLETLRGQRLERTQLDQQQAALEQENRRLQQRLGNLEKEQRGLQLQQQQDRELIADRTRLEQEFERYQQLRIEASQWDTKARQFHTLGNTLNALDARIAQTRHEVERRREKWDLRRRDLEQRVKEYDFLISQAQTIEARYTRLTLLREEEQVLEQQRQQYEELQREKLGRQHHIDLEKQRLASQQAILESQREGLQRQLEQGKNLAKKQVALEQELARLHARAEELKRLQEQQNALRVRLDHQRQRIKTQTEEVDKAHEKVHLLQASSTAQCPLCGSQLDTSHRHLLAQELFRQQQQQTGSLKEEGRIAERLEAELRQKGEYDQQLASKVAPLPEREQELARLVARQDHLQEAHCQLKQLETQLSSIAQQLAAAQFAPDQRQQLTRVEAALGQLAYQPEKHLHTRQALRQLLPAESEYARLQDAHAQLSRLRTALEEAGEKRILAQQYLEQQRYAKQEQEERRIAAAQRDELAYDPEVHRQLQQRLEESSDIIAIRERLIAAQQRHASNEETLTRNQAELLDLHKRSQELDSQRRGLEERIAALATVEQQFAALHDRLLQERATRDRLLQQQGAIQARCERCRELAAEKQQCQETQATTQREAWIYQQLSDAFGKDGIQALIIENTIPEIEREANAILARLTDNRIQIAIESLRDLKKGGTRETLDIKIADEVGERSYHLYSGGEAFRTDFALRIALSRVLAMRAGTRLRTLIIDEGFGTQDSQGLEQLIEAIQEIGKDFDKVLVVTHLPALKNAFPVQIQVTKYPDIGSRFEIIHTA